MRAKLIANDNGLPRDELLALARLLKEARCIEHDLAGRLAQHPIRKFLLTQHNEYQQLVGSLLAI
jgi:hypothetical protein